VKSLSLFQHPEFIKRDEKLLEAVGIDPSIATEVSVSRMTTRRAIFKKSEENRLLIQSKLPVIAAVQPGIGVSFDHKSIARHHVQGETDIVLGIGISITNPEGKRITYPVAFEHTKGETHPEAIETVERVLEDYGILAAVHSGHITMISDYALWGASKDISFNTAVDFNHSIDRLIKRTVLELLPKFSEEAVVQFKKTTKLSNYAHKSLSKAEMRRLPDSVEPTLNEYLLSKGSKVIPTYTAVRFRSLYQVVEAMHSGKSTILDLVNDETNPNHRHVANIPNMAFVEALFDLMEAFIPLINFCDSTKTKQAGEYIAETEYLLQYACSDSLPDNEFAVALKKSLIAAVLEQLIGHYIVDDETIPSSVRTRLLPNELVLLYGCLPRKACMLEKVRFILKNGGHYVDAQLVKDFVIEKDLKTQAIIQIKKYDALLNEQSDIVEFDSDDSCLSEDSDPLFSAPANLSSSSNPTFTSRSPIEKEIEKYNNLDITFWRSFKTRKFNILIQTFNSMHNYNLLKLIFKMPQMKVGSSKNPQLDLSSKMLIWYHTGKVWSIFCRDYQKSCFKS